MHKKFFSVAGFIVLIAVAGYFCISNSALKEIMLVLISSVGAIAVILQLKASTDISKGEFIINLQEMYSSNDKFIDLFEKCWANYNGNMSNKCLAEYLEEHADVLVNYFTFFESIYLMLEQNVLKLDIIDDLFSRRFFIVVNNITVQKMDLVKNYKYYLNVLKLYLEWKKYKIRIVKKGIKKKSSQNLGEIKRDLFLEFDEKHQNSYCDLQEKIMEE